MAHEHKLSPSALLQKAWHCYQHGQLDTAEQYCLKICNTGANQPDTLHLLAVIYAQTQHYPLANDYFEQAIASDAQRADFYRNYANALWEQGCFDAAQQYGQQSSQLDPSNADTFNILGSIALSQNHLDDAATHFRQALTLHPDFPLALNNLGNTLQKMDQTEAAINHYRQALALQENYPEAHYNLGLGLKRCGKIDEARQHFQRAVALRPDFHEAQLRCVETDLVWLKALEGKHLLLRRFQPDDAAYLHRCYQDAAFMTLYNHAIPRYQQLDELTDQLRQAHAKHPCQLQSVDWVIINKKNGRPTGIANLVEIQFAHHRAEFQIGLPESADRTSGIGLEATLLVLDFAFNRVGFNKLTTLVYGHNQFSQKSTLSLGFTQESYLREHLLDVKTKQWIDLYGNGMTLKDFRSNNRLAKLSLRLLGRDIANAK